MYLYKGTLIILITVLINLWKTICSEINIPFLLTFWKILRLVLLLKGLHVKKRGNSYLDTDRSDFLANKSGRLVLGLYV